MAATEANFHHEPGPRLKGWAETLNLMRDEDQRDRMTRKLEVVTLVGEPSVVMVGNNRSFVFRGVQEGRQYPIRAVMNASVAERTDLDAIDDMNDRLRRLGGGDKMSLAGHWHKIKYERNGEHKERWEFKVQRFAEGDVSLDRVRAVHMASDKRMALKQRQAAEQRVLVQQRREIARRQMGAQAAMAAAR